MNKKLSDFDFMEIFPENLKRYKNLRKLAIMASDALKREITDNIPQLAIYKNLELQSNEVLSELADQMSIDNWSEGLERTVKINLIKKAYWTHSKKGTKGAVIDSLATLGYPIELKEWFEETDPTERIPFTYALTIKGQQLEEGWLAKINEIIGKYKNCRSIMREARVVDNPVEGNLRVHCLITTKEYREVPINNNFNVNSKLNVAVFMATKEKGVINAS